MPDAANPTGPVALPPGDFPRSGPAALPPPQELWLDDLRKAAAPPTDWLWHGYLAPGNVTVLTSQWKTGKSTLLSVLLARLKHGGHLAGLRVAPARAAVVSEESAAHWLSRSEKLDYAGHVCWFCQPFPGKPTAAQWLALLDRLTELHARHGLGLVAIDSLAEFFPGRGENHVACMLDFLMPLRRLTARGLAVLLLHHPGKVPGGEGLLARGSGALSSFADILIEKRWYAQPSEGDRRRRLLAFSRHEQTPRQLVIELNAAGTDYLGHGSFLDEEFTVSWQVLRTILETAPRKLTSRQLARRWPAEVKAPAAVTLYRWLERAVGQGLLLREGSGRRRDAFRYWLPGHEERLLYPWKAELEAFIERMQQSGDPADGTPPAQAVLESRCASLQGRRANAGIKPQPPPDPGTAPDSSKSGCSPDRQG
jgi:hypothetical protein